MQSNRKRLAWQLGCDRGVRRNAVGFQEGYAIQMRKWVFVIVAGGCIVAGCLVGSVVFRRGRAKPLPPGTLRSVVTVGTHPYAWQNIIEGAHEQASEGAKYDASYVRIAYPNGDVPLTQGACTDVIVRALRHAGYDLQSLIHEDIEKHPSDYPLHGRAPDSNIDHRRVPNQIVFFRKYGQSLPLAVNSGTLSTWRPGDFVYWSPFGGEHTGVVSDDVNASGVPMVIHNLGGCHEEDCLTRWPIVGHYRFPAEAQGSR